MKHVVGKRKQENAICLENEIFGFVLFCDKLENVIKRHQLNVHGLENEEKRSVQHSCI